MHPKAEKPTGHPHGRMGGHPGHQPGQKRSRDTLRLVAWETTRSCNLKCVHCRAAAHDKPYEGELSTEAVKKMFREIRELGEVILIMTGGEPLLRPDIFELAQYGTDLGLRMTMAPNGTLMTPEVARKMVDSGIQRISMSIDGATREVHDDFRGMPGAFEGVMHGIQCARDAGLEFQINTTITKKNLDQIPAILEMAVALGAAAHHIFLLVPTGRGKEIEDVAINAAQYEETLNWFYDQRGKVPLQLKATCAPHYYRILRQRAKEEGRTLSFEEDGLDAVTRGCLGGIGFCFVSHIGEVQPCGFLEVKSGDVTKENFVDIWKNSPQFLKLRDYDALQGKCGACEYKSVCGGCRARAYEATGDMMNPEPLCEYVPKKMQK